RLPGGRRPGRDRDRPALPHGVVGRRAPRVRPGDTCAVRVGTRLAARPGGTARESRPRPELATGPGPHATDGGTLGASREPLMASGGEATWDSESAEAPVNRYALTRAEVLGVVIATAIIVVLVRFAGLPIQAGDDFLWYRNGVDRLVAGLPPYDPRLLAGSYA